MTGTWDFGGGFADTEAKLQQTNFARLAFPLEQQARQNALDAFPLEQQERRNKLEAFPSGIAQSQAAARLNNANASILEHRQAAEKRMGELMKGETLGDTGGSAGIMKLAGVAMQAGDSTTARELIAKAAQVRLYETREDEVKARQAKAETDARLKMAERYTQLLSGVNSQQSFDQANKIFQAEFGEEPPAIDYHPETVRILRESTLKLRDRAYMNHLRVTEGLAGARLNETRRYHDESLEIRRQAEARRQAETGRKEKEGGKDVGAPSSAEVKQAENLLRSQKKMEGLDAPTQKRAAADLAARARALRKQNPGLDAAEAQQRALVEQVAQGYFSTEKATSGLSGLLGRSKNVYGKPGGTPDRPVPVPKDASARKSGTYYTTPRGTLLYLGDGKWQAPGGDDEDEE